MELDAGSSWELFLFYGQNDLELECLYDLWELLLQPKRSLYFYREASAGIQDYENNPNTIQLRIFLPFDIAYAVAYRNSIVSNGEEGYPDRRIGVSQQSIGLEQTGENVFVKVLYFLYANYEKPKGLSLPLVR